MEKENIITVDIEDFKDSQHVLDYIDDDFAIVNSLEGTPYSNDTIKLNCFLIAVCIEGCIQLDVNYRTYKLQAGELLLGLPQQGDAVGDGLGVLRSVLTVLAVVTGAKAEAKQAAKQEGRKALLQFHLKHILSCCQKHLRKAQQKRNLRNEV